MFGGACIDKFWLSSIHFPGPQSYVLAWSISFRHQTPQKHYAKPEDTQGILGTGTISRVLTLSRSFAQESQGPRYLQSAVQAAQHALMQPNLTLAAASAFRPVLLHLVSAFVEGASATHSPSAQLEDAHSAIAMVKLLTAAPHIQG